METEKIFAFSLERYAKISGKNILILGKKTEKSE